MVPTHRNRPMIDLRSQNVPTEARTGFIEGWILDGPWTLAALLFATAVGLLFLAINRDDSRLGRFALGTALAAALVLAIGIMVETPSESARAATERFVEAAVDGRVDDLLRTLDEDATLHVARVENPGFPRSNLEEALDGLRNRHRIDENSITLLDAAEARDGAVWVELACITRTASSGGWVPSRWILEWQRADPGEWRIRSITAMKIAGVVPRDPFILR